MSDLPGARALPRGAVLFLALAVLLIWIGVLLILAGLLLAGPRELTDAGFLSLPGTLGDSPMANAVALQWAASALSMGLLWILGSIILAMHLSGRPERAADLMIWLIRIWFVVTVLGPAVAAAPLLAFGGIGAPALFAILPNLPQTLLTLAFLICAAAYLKRGAISVF